MADLFSTDVLTGVINSVKPAPQFLLDRYFGSIQTEEAEEIHFDVVSRGRNIAPFVSPVVEGKIIESQGFDTKTFKPAYLKPKHVFNPRRALKRAPGEAIGGSLSAQQRIDRLVRMDMEDHRNRIDRRLEVMAAEALRLGQVTVSGEQYPTQVVSFGRAAGHTLTLGSGVKWGEADVKPLDDLQDWVDIINKAEGVAAFDVIMTTDVWKVFRADAQVEKRLDVRRVEQGTMDLGAQQREGGVYRGSIDGFNIFTYAGWYIDPDTGVETEILPAGTVLLTGPALEGVRAFGAVAQATDDGNVILRAVPYAPTSWVDRDPPMRYLMTQSAPLVVPYRVNASLAATVL